VGRSDSAGKRSAGASVATSSDGCGARDASSPPLTPTGITTQAVSPQPPHGEDCRVDVAGICNRLVRAVDPDPDCRAGSRDAGVRRRLDLARAPVRDRFRNPRMESLADSPKRAPTRSVRGGLTGVAARGGVMARAEALASLVSAQIY